VRRISAVAAPVRLSLVAAVVAALCALALTIGQAVVLARILSSLFAHAHVAIGAQLITLVVLCVARVLIAYVQEVAGVSLAAPVRRALRRRAFSAMLNDSGERQSDALVLVTRGVDAVELYLARYLPAFVLAGLAPVCLLAWCVVEDPLSAVIIGATLLVLPVFMILLGLEASATMRRRWSEQQRLAASFGDVVAGMATLKAHNRSEHAVDQLDEIGVALRDSTMATLKIAFLSSFALELLASLGTALVALVLGIRLLSGSMSLASALAVLIVTPEVYLPLRRASAQYHGNADGIAASEQLLTLIEAQELSSATHLAPERPPTIEVRSLRVDHAGRRHEDALDISFVAPSGTTTLLQGPSGVGKTSTLRQLVRLEQPAPGTVFVDGVDLLEIDRDSWHQSLAWLAQDPSVPGETVREALLLGRTDISDDQLREALSELGLHFELERKLGEPGATLSAGELRRLALARCLLRRPILIVLDEPTAHVDEQSKELILRALRARRATLVIATHDDIAGDHVVEMQAPERFSV
jgi:ATP-binding cassette subfamily C protein CydCD